MYAVDRIPSSLVSFPDDPDVLPADGRSRRRQRNIQSVRDAILDMFDAGTEPTMRSVADRAGVAVRSIYRYYDDLDDAIADAVDHRYRVALHQIRTTPAPDLSATVEDRLDLLLTRRLRLMSELAPVRTDAGHPEVLEAMDAEVRSTLAPEIDGLGAEGRQIATVLSVLLRTASLRSLTALFDGERELRTAVERAVTTLLRRPS